MLSLIVPCYNEEENVFPFFDTVLKAFEKSVLEYEIIYINDGSRDNTELNLKKLWENHSNIVSVVNFSRNFGKESAILAGLKHAKGDYVTIIDADLQQRPEIVLEMVDFLNNHTEYDVVAAYQIQRIEGKVISFYKKVFNKLFNKVCDIEIHSGASDFRTFRRKVVEAILSVPEYFRFSKGIFSWVGFETYYMPYIADERNSGETKWSIWRLFKYALEGFISFSTFPLRIATYLGGGFSTVAIIYMIIVIIQKLFFSISIPGYTTIVVLILVLGGLQLMILGIIGEYLARIYIQGKNRPIYIEKECLDNEKKNMEID